MSNPLEKPLPPTGKRVEVTAIKVFSIADVNITHLPAAIGAVELLHPTCFAFIPPGQA